MRCAVECNCAGKEDKCFFLILLAFKGPPVDKRLEELMESWDKKGRDDGQFRVSDTLVSHDSAVITPDVVPSDPATWLPLPNGRSSRLMFHSSASHAYLAPKLEYVLLLVLRSITRSYRIKIVDEHCPRMH